MALRPSKAASAKAVPQPGPELVIRIPPKGGAWVDRAACPQVDLGATAANLGTSGSHLSYVINGRRRPSMRLAQRIAAMLGLSLDDIGRAIDRGQISKLFNRAAKERRKQQLSERAGYRRKPKRKAESEGPSRPSCRDCSVGEPGQSALAFRGAELAVC